MYSENARFLVIDFGGTLAKYSVMDREGKVFAGGEAPSPVSDKESYIGYIVSLYEEASENNEIVGVALSMPGVIETDTGLLRSAGSFPALYGMNVKEELKAKIPVPVSVENDGKCGALAEVWQGKLSDCEDGIVLIIGTGIAGGVIKGREIHKGKHLSAGEFSYFMMGGEPGFGSTVLAKCGVAPLLFEVTRRHGIDVKKSPAYPMCSLFMSTEQELGEKNDMPEYDNGIDGYKFFELLESGDEIASELFESYTGNLAILILNLCTVYDPDRVLIGGGVSRQPRLIEGIKKQCERVNSGFFGMYQIPCELDVCKFGNEANQYGALYHFLCENS